MLSGSEASGLTNRTAWSTLDAERQRSMTCPGAFVMA